VLRQGACKLLAQVVDAEVADFLGVHADLTTEDGHDLITEEKKNLFRLLPICSQFSFLVKELGANFL